MMKQKIEKQKIYCYVDESGQDTGGEIFLVAVVLKNEKDVNKLRENLEEIEKNSGKHKRKWTKTPNYIKIKYLEMLLENNELKNSIFYSVYKNSKTYSPLLALTIAKSINAKNLNKYSASIIIDGLNSSETEYIRSQLKSLKINYKKIRGMKDGQEPLLRLADSMAGFIRDSIEGQDYTLEIFKKFVKNSIIMEI